MHYSEITKTLNLRVWNPSYNSELTDPVLRAVEKFKSHPSIVNIKTDNPISTYTFRFREVTLTEVENLVMNLDCTKTTGGPISAKLLKLSSNVVCIV